MISTEEKDKKLPVIVDGHGDFKIVPKKAENPLSISVEIDRKQTLKERELAEAKKHGTPTSGRGKKQGIRSKPFIPTKLPKEEIRRIRHNVSIQRISDYVRIVSPDDGVVDEKGFLAFIKWQLMKKYPEKYLEATKRNGVMVPVGEGKLKFTKSW